MARERAKDVQIIGVKAVDRMVYITRSQMIKIFDMSPSTASRRIADLDKYVEKGRYGAYTILDGAGVTWINLLALIDLMKYKKRLDAGWRVPPFRPEEVAKEALIDWDKALTKINDQ